MATGIVATLSGIKSFPTISSLNEPLLVAKHNSEPPDNQYYVENIGLGAKNHRFYKTKGKGFNFFT